MAWCFEVVWEDGGALGKDRGVKARARVSRLSTSRSLAASLPSSPESPPLHTMLRARPLRHPVSGPGTLARPRPALVARAAPGGGPPAPEEGEAPAAAPTNPLPSSSPRTRRPAGSTDPVSSFLTRRFGLAGGLAWLAVLTAGSVGEQVKTRLENAAAAAGTAAVADAPPLDLGGGVVAQDVRVGGGDRPAAGLLAILELAAWPLDSAAGAGTPTAALAAAAAAGPPFLDSKDTGKPLVLLVGGRPLTGGLCPGAEAALLGMRAGGKRVVLVPASAGFGDRGTQVRPTRHSPEKGGIVPPGQDLVYSIELVRVSVRPS